MAKNGEHRTLGDSIVSQLPASDAGARASAASPSRPATMITAYLTMPSPVGELLLTAVEDGLTRLWFEEHRYGGSVRAEWRRAESVSGSAAHVLHAAREQLNEYFAGARTSFDLPLAATGTHFQERVWTALRTIPFGHTMSYGELAVRLGEPKAVRAVGSANGHNPISIVVPCHRVIGARGALTGFGGGLERKRWLLEHEGAIPATLLSASEASPHPRSAR
jgi:methylated-DNA-[protein]-cysteine S-methyltransferase